MPRILLIDDEEVERSGSKQVETLEAVVGDNDVMRLALQHQLDRSQNRVIIIDDENASHGSP